ncbi:hypothetical protein DTO212C5_2711 [Paecilomyces variotii]|nr:hypothetical protein DTO212C5_2711 [Paecilomyces variotii]
METRWMADVSGGADHDTEQYLGSLELQFRSQRANETHRAQGGNGRNLSLKRKGNEQYQSSSRHKRQHLPGQRSAPRASQACDACAMAKARCDNEKTCRRCQRRGQTCVRPYASYQDTDGSHRHQAPRFTRHTPPSAPMAGEMNTEASGQMTSLDAMGEEEGAGRNALDVPMAAVDLRTGSDWDLMNDSNLFDLASSMDYSLSTPDIDFLSSLYPDQRPSKEAREKPSSLSPPAMSPICLARSESSQAVLNAFSLSVGQWYPEKKDYRANEERHLALNHAATLAMDCLGVWDPSVTTDSVKSITRDKLLAMMVNCCEPSNIPAVLSAFPATEVLDRILKVFLSHHALQTDTYLHIPSFRSSEAEVELVAACIAAGALRSSSRGVQRFGLAILEILTVQLFQVMDKSNILSRDLQYVQAHALLVQVGQWSGIKRKMERAGGFCGILLNMLRGSARFRRGSYSTISPAIDDHGPELELKWRRWVQEESWKRLAHNVHAHCVRASLVTHVGAGVTAAEMCLPVPEARELWQAKSASEWKDIYLRLQPSRPPRSPSVSDCLGDPDHCRMSSSLFDKQLLQLSVLYATLSLILQTRDTRSVLFAGESDLARNSILSDDSQHIRLLQILQDIRRGREDDDPERPPTSDLLLELCLMHLYAPFDQIELVTGREGIEEAQAVYPLVSRWAQTERARIVCWHAGQVLRFMRSIPSKHLLEFHAVPAYHASMCLWVYGSMSNNTSLLAQSQPVSSSTSSSPPTGVLFLDGEETLEMQKWIRVGRGSASLSVATTKGRLRSLTAGKGEDGDDNTNNNEYVPILETDGLMRAVVQRLTDRFTSVQDRSPPPLLVQNICRLLLALGALVERANFSEESAVMS